MAHIPSASSSDEIASLYDDDRVTSFDDLGAAVAERESTSRKRDADEQADERAIEAVTRFLHARNSSKPSSDFEEPAVVLYAKLCQAAPQMDAASFANFAKLVGEQPDELRERLGL